MSEPEILSVFTPTRPLTRKECIKIFGGIVGALADMVEDVTTLRDALAWWVSGDTEAEAAWTSFVRMKEMLAKIREAGRPGTLPIV